MRLFVAIELADEAVRAAMELVRTLRSRTERLAPASRVTWVSESRIHLTVRFIGHASDDRVAGIAAALRIPLDVRAFPLTLAGLGAFPERGAPRVLWAGVESDRESLADLEREVSRRLETQGVAADNRPYRPHLTLARVREPGGLRPSRLFEGLGEARLGTTPVEAITLFESRVSPKGSQYVPLQRTPLAEAGQTRPDRT